MDKTTLTFEQFQPLIARFLADCQWFWPELLLIVVIALLLLSDLFLPRSKSRNLFFLAMLGTVAALLLVAWDLFRQTHGAVLPKGGEYPFPYLFQGMVIADKFAYFCKIVVLAGTIGVIAMSYKEKRFNDYTMGEYYTLLLSSVLGMLLMVSATDMLMFYLAMELTSIPSYLLVGYHRDDPKGLEASLKYIIYGAVASGIMIYGLSWIYGVTGSLKISQISLGHFDKLFSGLVLLMVFAGIAYKISTVPMQFWVPDVYEGAPTPVTAFLAVTSKAAGFAFLLRLVHALRVSEALPASLPPYIFAFAVIAALTMTIGNFMALNQKNVKRLLAFSAIAHAGYLMMGVCVFSDQGQTATLFYLAGYMLMNLGAFYIAMIVANATDDDNLTGFNGLGTSAPFFAGSMSIMLFSLIGIPPTVGFVGKFQLIASVLSSLQTVPGWLRLSLILLVLIAVLNTVVSLYYYARILKAMYFEESKHPGIAPSALNTVTVFVLAAGTLGLGIFFNWLIEGAKGTL
jgi:NADH-quinone oxidoreductase subunit N